MRDSKIVLNNLSTKTKDENYKFQRLYRNLYNKDFYLQAYSKIYAKEGNMTPGVDSTTIDAMSLQRIEQLIESLKDESYQPKPVRRKTILKKNGGHRPLGIPSFDDKLLQEVIRQILEAIYEEKFTRNSYGFRAGLSCHTALTQIKNTFVGVKWFIEGDIKSFFDNINHQTLINLLRKYIEDEKFLRVVQKFLKAGYMEDWKFHKTYSGTPQGGIISPLLANIYLHELDKFMDTYKQNFDSGKFRKLNPTYKQIDGKLQRLIKKNKHNWQTLNEQQKREILRKIRDLQAERRKHPYYNQMDENYRRIQYVRYADDFLIGVIGDKEDAERVKEDVSIFLKQRLSLDLSMEKTLITHNSKSANFLGYNITISRSQSFRKTADGKKIRTMSGKPDIYIPTSAMFDKLKELRVIRSNPITNKPVPWHRPELAHLEDIEILDLYNAQIRGFYNYYRLAKNAYILNGFMYYMKFSMYKTFGNKYKKSVSEILNKYKSNGEFTVLFDTKKGKNKRILYNKGFSRDTTLSKNDNVDTVPNPLIHAGRNSVVSRMLAEKCEICGAENTPIEMHHIRKLKDLKGGKMWEKLMIARRRKTLALCKRCHSDLHAGRLD